jgi:hypothetical protein
MMKRRESKKSRPRENREESNKRRGPGKQEGTRTSREEDNAPKTGRKGYNQRRGQVETETSRDEGKAGIESRGKFKKQTYIVAYSINQVQRQKFAGSGAESSCYNSCTYDICGVKDR